MKTLHRLYLILALLILGIFGLSKARAETWYVAPNTTPLTAADVAVLPLAVTFDWLPANPEWTVPNGMTWNAIWPRNAAGAWYRPSAYTQITQYQSKPYPWAYTCRVYGLGFKCLDKARGIERDLRCPAFIYSGPMKLWRSQHNAAWPELGLFTANVGPFSAAWGKGPLPVTGAVVTGNGQQVNCQYGRTTAQGPDTTMDWWIYRR